MPKNELRSQIRYAYHRSESAAIDAVLKLAVSRVRKTVNRPGRTLVIAAPGGGNLGDEAMLHSVLEVVEGPVDVVVSQEDAYADFESPNSDVTFHVLPSVLYGKLDPRLVSGIRTLVNLLKQSKACLILGADTLDGAYNYRASYRRAAVGRVAAMLGLQSRILGFSWNGTNNEFLIEGLQNFVESGGLLFPRDPVSSRRLTDAGVANVPAADVVFTSTFAKEIDLDLPDSYALINISGHIAKEHDLTADYVEVSQELQDAGMTPVVVCHVRQAGSDDRPSAVRLANALSASGIDHVFVDEPLRYPNIRHLVRKAKCVVTGRMHLGVIAVSEATPSLILSTQGKVEGLQELIPMGVRSVDPLDFGAAATKQFVADLVQHSTLAASGPEVRRVQRFAAANFEGL